MAGVVMSELMFGLIWLGFFAAVFFGWYFFIQARNKERMGLIEKGKDVSEIFSKREREIRFRFPWLKLGMLITGVGFGFVSVSLLMATPAGEDFVQRTNGMIIAAAIIFFGGLAMVVAHYIDKPKN